MAKGRPRVRSAEFKAAQAKKSLARRERNRQAQPRRCINDTNVPSHGPPIEGETRCQSCKDTHRSTRKSLTPLVSS